MATMNLKSDIEALEKKFWQSMIDNEPQVATGLLFEPALMVSGHGSNKFDHAGYTKMANDDRFKLLDYKLSDFDVVSPTPDVAVATYQVHQTFEAQGQRLEQDVYDTSTWVKSGDRWRCVIHTESERSPKS